jgi:hypothetical protein
MLKHISIDQQASIDWGLNINQAAVFSVIFQCDKWAYPIRINRKGKEILFYEMSLGLLADQLKMLGIEDYDVRPYMIVLEKKGLIEWVKIPKPDMVRITKKGMSWKFYLS